MKNIASSRLHSVRLLILLACLSLAQPFAALAQTDVPAPLPPAAQEAFDKGIMAAREQGYLVAIRYLQEARKLAPQAPQIFRSLGAVEAKIPSRELRAIAWYGAYLAALPQAPDAADVKNEIVRLEIKSQISISGLIKSLQDAAGQVHEGVPELDVAKVQIMAGDIAAAKNNLVSLRDQVDKAHKWFTSRTQAAISEAQIEAGDIAGAQKTLASALKNVRHIDDKPPGLMPAAVEKISTLERIASAQAKAGDIAGAKKTADLIKSEYPDYEIRVQTAIAEAQIKAGDIGGAQKTLTSALKSADLIQDARASAKSLLQSAIAEVQIKAGDIAGAQNTLASALINAGLITLINDGIVQGAYWKVGALTAITEAQAKSGDIAGAQKTFIEAGKTSDRIPSDLYKDLAQKAIAEAQEKVGIITASDLTRRSRPDIQTPSRFVIPVSDWLTKLDDDNESNDCPLNTGPFLDLAGYLRSLPPSDDPQKVFESLHETAKTIVNAQNVITGMLEQQVGK